MPEKKTLERARKAKRAGKSPSTQAGEFVREEIHHVREGKHGASSTEQTIAIGLAKARRSGVKLKKPPKATKKRASSKSGRAAASSKSLSRHARAAAKRRTTGERSAAGKKAARTKGAAGRSAAARKAARTRKKRG